MTHGPASNLEVAQKRLKSFMDEHRATYKECANIMGISNHKELMRLMKLKEGSSMYQEMVIACFGTQGVEASIEKLHAMRGKVQARYEKSAAGKERTVATAGDVAAATASGEAKHEAEETVQQLAKRMYEHYCRKGFGTKVSKVAIVDRMNDCKPSTVTRTFKATSLSAAFSPSNFKTMTIAYSEDILTALAWCPWSTKMPVELDAYRVHHDADLSDDAVSESAPQSDTAETIQDVAIRRLKALKDRLGASWREMAVHLGYNSISALPNLCTQYNIGVMGEQAAKMLQHALDEYEKKEQQHGDESAADLQQNSADSELNETDHDGLDSEDHSPADGLNTLGEEEPLSPEDSAAEAEAYAPELTGAEAASLFAILAVMKSSELPFIVHHGGGHVVVTPLNGKTRLGICRDVLAEEMGCDLDDLKLLTPIVEHALVAMRNGTPCRLVVDAIEVR